MGLGKTLTMIALTASDRMHEILEDSCWKDPHNMRSVAATLIIVPQPRECRRMPIAFCADRNKQFLVLGKNSSQSQCM
jgi:hypothetical protein